MLDTVGDWLDLLHERYPPRWAQSWDNVGMQVGDPQWPVERVLVSLDVTSEVLDEAIDGPPTLLLAHHPLLFEPLTTLTPTTPTGRLALRAASERVAVAAAHTNLDVATDGTGTSQPVARLLELEEVRALSAPVGDGTRVKLVTFVPVEALDAVIDAVSEAGAGVIGDYERCTFRVQGTGTFRPGANADPYSGQVGRDAAEDEFRLETLLASSRIAEVTTALRRAHPYEEVAYDLYPLLDDQRPGIGLIGRLPVTQPLAEVAARIREQLPAPHLRFAGGGDTPVSTLAVVGGAGDSMIDAALAAGADVLVTGDLRHHVTLEALEQGLMMIDAGHHATESAALPHVVDRLTHDASQRGLTAPVLASRTPTVPWS